ncbi:MAG: hypothetical protein ACE5HO_10685 [bacterium]
MSRNRTLDPIPILVSSVLGLLYVYFFGGKDYVLLVVFGLQTLRCGLALRTAAKKGRVS